MKNELFTFNFKGGDNGPTGGIEVSEMLLQDLDFKYNAYCFYYL